MPVTRRDFLATSAVAAIAGAIGRPHAAAAWRQAQAQTPVFTDLRRKVGFFTMLGGTIGYLNEPRGGIVVDSQFPQGATAFIQGWNERSKSAAILQLINTHHHGDHTGGNIAFKGIARHVLAHEKAAEHMKNPPGQQPPTTEQLYPDRTFTNVWREQTADEWVRSQYYGPAHTSGDAVVTFERANVAHMGDLMFHQRHPVIDKAAGASIRNWISVLEKVPGDHSADTIYIFGHAGTGQPVTGPRAALLAFRDYLTALLAFVESQLKAGKSRDEILATQGPLPGFDAYGPLPKPAPRGALYSAVEEVTGK
jgi:glyoxylase-like metal-dependent hydrolase (beta-lactamase superfamily II)